MSNIQLMIKADVLGAPVDGVFVKKNTLVDVKLSDANTAKCNLTANTTLVYGKPESPVNYTITELIAELGKLLTVGFVSQDTIKAALPQPVADKLSEISFAIRMIYYTQTKATLTHTKPADKTPLEEALKPDSGDNDAKKQIAEAEKKSEYAVWVDVTFNENLLRDFPIKISELSFKVWSTNNAKVLTEMEITKVNELLRGAGIALPGGE